MTAALPDRAAAPDPAASPDGEGRPARPLWLKLAALSTGLVLVPVPLVGALLLARAQASLEEQLQELQLSVADEVAAAVEHETVSARDGLETLSGVLLDPELGETASVQVALRVVEGHASLDHVAVYDRDGALIDRLSEVETEEPLTPRTLPEAARVAAARDGVAAYGPVAGGRLPVVIPMRPVGQGADGQGADGQGADGQGAEVTGYLATPLDLAPLEARVRRIAAHRFGGLPDTILLVDARREAIARASPGPTRAASHPLVRGLRRGRFETTFAQQLVYTEPGEEERVGTLVGIPAWRWGVIVQVPTRVAFAPIREMRAWVLGTVAATALLAMIVGLLFARSITRPLRALTDFAGRLGRRELGGAVSIPTRDELRVLGDAMSRASMDLADSDARIRKEEAIRKDLGRYLPMEIVDRVVAREQDMRLGGTRQEITVLFADIVAFTPLTESRDPEEVVALLNEHFTILTEIVFRHGGTVDKFIGDCVMALFGAPEASEDHAARALRASEDMVSWLETGNARWEKEYGLTLRLAIGVHSGAAVVGNVGSETRMTYTAIGDVVNVAARLEAMARPGQVLCTAATREAAGDAFEYTDLGERELSGRRGLVHLYAVDT